MEKIRSCQCLKASTVDLQNTTIVFHEDGIVYLLQVVLQLSQDDLQLIDFARERGRRRIAADGDGAVSLCMNTCCIVCVCLL